MLWALAGLISAAAVKVAVTGGPGSFQLERGGEPFFIQGAGGDHSWTELAHLGGNAQRTWGSDQAADQLAQAEKLGIVVAIGIWLGDVNLNDAGAKQAQIDQVVGVVRANKNSPAVLAWGIGNEQELNHQNEFEKYFEHYNNIVKAAHAEDPNHPCMPVLAEVTAAKAAAMKSSAPDVDFWGINSYAGGPTLAARWENDLKMNKPFAITEFGPIGQWECDKQYGQPIELTSDEKAKHYADTYTKSVLASKGKYCVGSFAFLWGDKVEETPYWFGMFMPTGERLQSAETIAKLWRGGSLPAGENQCPVVSSVKMAKTEGIAANEGVQCTVTASDPDGNALTYDWLVIGTDGARQSDGTIPAIANAIAAGAGTATVTVKIADNGVYRAYCFIRDGKGAGAIATVMFKVG